MATSTPRYGYPIIEPNDRIRTANSQAKLAADINRVSIRSEAVAAGLDAKAASSVANSENAKNAADAANARNLLQDIALEAQDLRVRALEALGSLDPGEVSDGTVAALVNNDESLSHEALESSFVKRGTLVHDVRDYGAKGDNTTDDSAAFQAAIEAARVTRGRAYAWGTFRLDQPIIVTANADFNNATVNYFGEGAAITLQGYRLDVSTPSLFNGRKTSSGGWDHVAGTIGVLMRNCNGCMIHVKFVQGFEEGLTVLGANGGCAYNTVVLGWLFNNKRNQVLATDSTTSVGYSNQNTYIGGRLSHHAGEGENLPGVQQLVIGGTGDGGPNSNLWLNTCLEGSQAEYAFDIERGRYNRLVNVRLEYGNAVRFGTRARDNEVTVGYYTELLPQVREDVDGFSNDLIYSRKAFLYDKDDEQWRTGDTHPWMRHRWSNRSFALGSGSSAPLEITAGGTSFTFGGSIHPSEDHTYDLGTTSSGWRHANISGRITSGGGIDFRSTASLPAADGRARMHVVTNGAGKMELRVRWPNGSLSTIAEEP